MASCSSTNGPSSTGRSRESALEDPCMMLVVLVENNPFARIEEKDLPLSKSRETGVTKYPPVVTIRLNVEWSRPESQCLQVLLRWI